MFEKGNLKIEGYTNNEMPIMHQTGSETYPVIECLVYGDLDTGYGYGIREWSVMDGNFSNADNDDYGFEMSAVERWWYWDEIKEILG